MSGGHTAGHVLSSAGFAAKPSATRSAWTNTGRYTHRYVRLYISIIAQRLGNPDRRHVPLKATLECKNPNMLACTGEELQLQNLRKKLQALVHAIHAPSHPLGHAAVSVSVLREEVPSEVGHEKAYVHPHR